MMEGYKSRTITIKFSVFGFDVISNERLSEALTQVLSFNDDCRYPFKVELVHNGLVDCVKEAISEALFQDVSDGQERVKNGEADVCLTDRPTVISICDGRV